MARRRGQVGRARGGLRGRGRARSRLALVRRFRRRWWVPGSAAVVAIGVVTVWLFPVVIDPLFNKFEPLPRGQLRCAGARAGAQGRRGRGPGLPRGRQPPDHRRERLRERARALEAGGALRQPDRGAPARPGAPGGGPRARPPAPPRPAARPGVAGPRGARGHACWRSGWPSASAAARASTTRAGAPDRPRCPRSPSRWRSCPSAVGIAGNQLSRPVEASADEFSLDLTRDPAAHIALEREIAVRNVSDPDPPRLLHTAVRHPSHDAGPDRDRRGLGARALI